MSLLKVKDLYAGYSGGIDILSKVNLYVDPGEIVTIAGPNGAGKSTVMKSIFGLTEIREGSIIYNNADITGMRPDLIVKQGLCYVPQENNVFPSLTVKENLEMGAFIRNDDYKAQIEKVFELFPPLKEKHNILAGQLSGGQRQMVAMGRALMLDPKLLLLDEPSAGLSPLFTEHIFELIIEINRLNVGILMVEQNAKDALAFSHRGYIMTMGTNRYEDTGVNLINNKEVAQMFLGG
jgi:ABC-type branched-subunit amino acid transport system ATPase component